MEQHHQSNSHACLIFAFSVAVHLILLWCMTLYRFEQRANLLLHEQDLFLVDHIVSAGQEKTTVLFEDDVVNVGKASQDDALQDEQPQQEEAATQALAVEQPAITEQQTQPCAPPARKDRQKASMKRKRKSTNKKQSMTFNELSRGYIRYAQQAAGYNHTQRDSKYLALELYASKVWHCIKESFLGGESYLHLPQAVNVQTHLTLAIDRSGKLVDIHLVYPTQIVALQHIQEYIINRAKQAGLFPPFPEQLEGQVQRFSFPLLIKGEEGFHSYMLHYK